MLPIKRGGVVLWRDRPLQDYCPATEVVRKKPCVKHSSKRLDQMGVMLSYCLCADHMVGKVPPEIGETSDLTRPYPP